MSIFRRKSKKKEEERFKAGELGETKAYNLSDLDSLPKTDPGFRSATATVNYALSTLDKQIEEKRMVQKAARKITQTVRDMDLKWSVGVKGPKKAT